MGNTPNWNLPYPSDYNAPADVITDIQAIAEGTDAALETMAATVGNAAPVGTVVMYASATAPPGWHLCNGTAHGSAALQTILGSANTPDLRDRFIVGAGNAYALKATGGANSVLLTGDQSGVNSHVHPLSASADIVAAHTHGTGYEANFRASDGPRNETPNEDFYEIGQTGSNLDRTIPAGGAHGHAITGSVLASGRSDATAYHENRPPYYALTYIIRKD